MDLGITKLISDAQDFLPKIPEVLVAFLVGALIIYLVLYSLTHALKVARFPLALVLILKSLVAAVLWVILIADMLRQVGLSQMAITLSGSLLVFGLAVANGANTLVSDVISGLFLAKDPDFDIGYVIKSGEVEGTIETIDIRKTRIRTKNGTLLVVPNAVIDKIHWSVIDRPPKRGAKEGVK